MPVEGYPVEEVLERRVPTERQQVPESADGVPRQAVTRCDLARPTRVQKRHERNQREHTQIDPYFGQVVLAEEPRLPQAPVPTIEVRHQGKDAERRRITPRGGIEPEAAL